MSCYKYQKGSGFERDLVNLFWENGWAAARVAGSGSVKHSVPDLVAVKDGDIVAVECKTTGKDSLSLKKAVLGLKEYMDVSGARCFLSVKFDRVKPRFYPIDFFIGRNNFSVNKNTEFIDFEMVIGRQNRLA